MENIYLHAIDVNYKQADVSKTLSILEDIFQSRYLLSRRLRGDIDFSRGGFNGLDYVSLCDYDLRNAPPFENNKFYKGYTAYSTFAENSVSIMLNKDKFKTINPILIAPVVFDWDSLETMRYLGLQDGPRYSDMPDEVQVKGKISLRHLTGITIPVKPISSKDSGFHAYSKEQLIELYNGIKELMLKYGFKKTIYDLDTFTPIKQEDDISSILSLK